jgi:hypothetical protein
MHSSYELECLASNIYKDLPEISSDQQLWNRKKHIATYKAVKPNCY